MNTAIEIALDVTFVLLVLSVLIAVWRMIKGPSEADRAVASDLLLFGTVGMIATFGVRLGGQFTFDIVMVAAVLGFLSAVSVARALTRGKR